MDGDAYQERLMAVIETDVAKEVDRDLRSLRFDMDTHLDGSPQEVTALVDAFIAGVREQQMKTRTEKRVREFNRLRDAAEGKEVLKQERRGRIPW